MYVYICVCVNNVRSIITSHNTRIIRKSQTQVTSVDNCNCRNKEACPLQNKCMNKDIVYKATISTSNANDTKACFPLGGILRAERHFPPRLCSNKVESSSTFRSVARKMLLRAQNSA